MLTDQGCDVVSTISGIEGLICLKSGEFDVAFISMDMKVCIQTTKY